MWAALFLIILILLQSDFEWAFKTPIARASKILAENEARGPNPVNSLSRMVFDMGGHCRSIANLSLSSRNMPDRVPWRGVAAV
jgi:hypothetical protein